MKEIVQIPIPPMIQDLALLLKFEEVEILKYSQALHSTIHHMSLTESSHSVIHSFVKVNELDVPVVLAALKKGSK